MERLKDDYNKIEESIENIRCSLDRKSACLPDMHQELKGLKKKWEDMERAKELEGKLNDLNAELIWAKVSEKEKVLFY